MCFNAYRKWKSGGRTTTDTIQFNPTTIRSIEPISPTFRRRNGWQCPWDTMQMISWVCILGLSFLSVFVAIPLPYFPLFPSLIICLYLWNICWMCILTTKNPAEREAKYVVPVPFDRQRYQHVIENGYCHVCRRKAYPDFKHCRQCNKCIPNYDHHCKWLNTCIGGRNYKLFIILLVSLTIFSLTLFIVFLTFVILCLIYHSHSLPISKIYSVMFMDSDFLLFNYLPFLYPINWVILALPTAILYLCIFVLSAHLLSFHFLLWRTGQTTLAYFQQKQSETLEKQQQTNNTKITQQQLSPLQLTGNPGVYSIESRSIMA